MTAEMLTSPTAISVDPQTPVAIEELGARQLPARHGMARLLPVRAGQDGRLVFVVDAFYGVRMAGHQPVLSADGPRSLLSEATPLPIALEERLRSAYTTGRRQELLVRRGQHVRRRAVARQRRGHRPVERAPQGPLAIPRRG
ncbi:MAG: hypothetical protein R2755_20725 [Acidimicrobiales bacterium]